MELLLLFFAQFGSVFVMVMSSKLLRDDRVYLAMLNSFLITAGQLVFVEVIANSNLNTYAMFTVGGLGGSLGVGFSHWVYTKHIFKEK